MHQTHASSEQGEVIYTETLVPANSN